MGFHENPPIEILTGIRKWRVNSLKSDYSKAKVLKNSNNSVGNNQSIKIIDLPINSSARRRSIKNKTDVGDIAHWKQ